MAGVTHDSNITINITLDAAPAQETGFGTTLGIWPVSLCSLNSQTIVEYTDVSDAVTDNGLGYIDATALAAITAAFSQTPKPASVKLANYNDAVDVAAIKAYGMATGPFDTVLEAHVAGEAGNNYHVVMVDDLTSGSVTIEIDGYTFIIHYRPGTHTVANVETAITALSGANDVIDVKTGGTGATVLAGVDAREFELSSGADATSTETFAAALARISLVDDNYYGVFIAERSNAKILLLSSAIEATRKICAVQSADTAFLTGTYPSALTALQTRERTLIVWHDSATQRMDAAYLANRLVYDPDVQSASWDAPIAGVTPYTAAITAAQRSFALANYVGLGRPYGGSAFFVDAGVNATGRPMYEIETSDWFYARLLADVAAEKVNHSARGAKLTVDPVGQTKIKSLIDARGAQGLGGQSPHFLAFASQALAITTSDTAAQRMRFTAQAQLAVSGRLFTFNLNFSRTASA